MHNGFYTEHDSLAEDMINEKEISRKEELSFEFMELDNTFQGLSPYDFLHGNCFAFAKYLCETYGYSFRAIWDNDADCLIHAFCENSAGEFIDVRGITDDFSELVEEFDLTPEDIGYPEDYRYYIVFDTDKLTESKLDHYLKTIAKQIDMDYRIYNCH